MVKIPTAYFITNAAGKEICVSYVMSLTKMNFFTTFLYRRYIFIYIKDLFLSTVSFQHSELIPEEAHKVKCGLYAHKKTGKRVAVVAVDDDHVFSGSELPAENTIAHNLIAIRNRQTNKVRLCSCITVMHSSLH